MNNIKILAIVLLAGTCIGTNSIMTFADTNNSETLAAYNKSFEEVFSLVSDNQDENINNFGHKMIIFDPLRVDNTGVSIMPRTYDRKIGEIKDLLSVYGVIGHTQQRFGMNNYYDDKLKMFILTLCEYTSYENPDAVIDDKIVYIVNHLNELSNDMLSDIVTTYKIKCVENGVDGILSSSRSVYPYYLFTQTDSEWAKTPYANNLNRTGTIASSACGPSSMSIVLSQYFHKEILPTELAKFSIDNGHRYASGTGIDLFPDASSQYGMPIPELVYGSSVDELYDGVKNNGNMAIALMGKGSFTRGGHYVVIVGTEERDGKKYFKVADPNYPNGNYKYGGDKIIDDDPSDPFVLAETSIMKNETKNITWWKCNFSIDSKYKATENEILLASLTEDDFIKNIAVAVNESSNSDCDLLQSIISDKQTDSYMFT